MSSSSDSDVTSPSEVSDEDNEGGEESSVGELSENEEGGDGEEVREDGAREQGAEVEPLARMAESCKNVLGKQKGYTSLRVKLRKIAKKAKKSSKFKYAIEQEQRRLGLRGLTLKQEVKTRFTATQTMLRSFCNDANDREGREMDRAKVDANIKAINTAMEKAKFSKAQLSSLRLKSEDVTRMISLVKVLDVLEEGITLLGGQKYATGSVVLPFLKKIMKDLEPLEDEPVNIVKFKRDLAADLEQRCEENLDKNLLSKASFFDKRFSQLKFLAEEAEKEKILEEIEEELVEVEESMNMNRNQVEVNQNENPAKKRRLMGAGLSDEEEEAEGAKAEMQAYRAERKLKSDGCPLGWWRERKDNYPLLSKLARKYLAVQATSTPAERVMSTLGLVLDSKRQSLRGDLFDEIMFLTDCV